MTMAKKNSSRGLVMIMMMLIFACVFSMSIAADSSSDSSPSPSPSKSDSKDSKSDNKDSKSDDKDSKSDSKDSKDEDAAAAVKKICESMENKTKCQEFLWNSPNADPTHIVKFNLRVLKTLVEEGTYVSSKDELKNPSTPEKMKKSLHTCVENYEKAVDSLDDANAACKDCQEEAGSNEDKKCKPENVKKITSLLKDAVSNFKKCSEALKSADSPPKPWIKGLNEAMIDGAEILLDVAKKIK
ncbi:hypothetical protein LINGRAHAP2_LOCUS14450 [Linum grandiflorum]